jgi:hypothetical protein
LIETVLVTGGCGRLGRYVVDELRSRYRVTTLDVVESPWTLPHLALDILDLSGLYRACAGQDAVVHLAARRSALAADRAAEADTLETLRSVDDGVGSIMGALERAGSLDNTYVFYTSDNGFTFGEHRMFKGKDDQYRESITVPLLIAGPGVLKNIVREDVVANIDLAPTIVALTGAQPTLVQDGTSLVPLMTNASASWSRDLLLENYSNESAVTGRSVYAGIRNQGYRYTEYDYDYDGLIDDTELYRFVPDQCGSTTDSFELENQGHDACYIQLIRQLHARLQQLKTGI